MAEAFGIDEQGFEMPLKVAPSKLGDIATTHSSGSAPSASRTSS